MAEVFNPNVVIRVTPGPLTMMEYITQLRKELQGVKVIKEEIEEMFAPRRIVVEYTYEEEAYAQEVDEIRQFHLHAYTVAFNIGDKICTLSATATEKQWQGIKEGMLITIEKFESVMKGEL